MRVVGVASGSPLETADAFCERWTKQMQSVLKKVEVENLGKMDAARLWEAIPEEDGAGRGRRDLLALEHDLSVKVLEAWSERCY